MGGPEMAPHTPRRSERPGEAVALLDNGSAGSRRTMGAVTPRRLVLGVLLLVAASTPAVSAPVAHREVLPNGIVLLVAERPTVPIVAVRVLTQAGAAFAPDARAGLGHL